MKMAAIVYILPMLYSYYMLDTIKNNERFSDVQYICFHSYLPLFYDSLDTNSAK